MGYNITFTTVLLIVFLMVVSFSAGIWLAERFHRRAQAEQKEALQRQYLRLQAGSDADEPCQPYQFAPPNKPIGPITPEFMEELRQTGRARTEFRKGSVG